MDIISNCMLCGERALHVLGSGTEQVLQCINCGYSSADKFKCKSMKDNEQYKKLPDDMKSWAKEENGRFWIPTMFTLPFGTLYPIKEDGEMKWAVADLIDIPEKEQKNYPDPVGGYFKQKYDLDNPKIFPEFLFAMKYVNDIAKESKSSGLRLRNQKIKDLPKLKEKE